MNSKKILPGYC